MTPSPACAHSAELLGEVARYESIFLLCYLRGPAGIIGIHGLVTEAFRASEWHQPGCLAFSTGRSMSKAAGVGEFIHGNAR
jgi:hypothetical protein